MTDKGIIDGKVHGAICPVCHSKFYYETEAHAKDATKLLERRVDKVIEGIYNEAKKEITDAYGGEV